MELITAYRFAEYKIFSRHREGHGIHSPFVFDLVANVFRNKINTDIVLKVETIRKKLSEYPGSVNVSDPGSGSAKMKSANRRVADIVHYTAVPPKYGRLLSNMSAAFGRKKVVELGTSLGISTMYMAAACPETVVYTIEGSSVLSEIASGNFRIAGLDNIRLLKGSFDSMLPSIRNMKFCPGLVFIDGDHRKEPLLRYFRLIAGISDDKTVIIIDDIYNSGEMAEAWGEIKADKRVTLTIDIFRMGIVFFRKGMSRMDFVIRY
jgi:predicted O-methyltransferase YrrM